MGLICVGATPVTFAIREGQDGLTLTMADLIAGQTNFQNSNEGRPVDCAAQTIATADAAAGKRLQRPLLSQRSRSTTLALRFALKATV